MFDSSQYQLIDFGGGEKLERFGDRLVRRATPSVPLGGRKPAVRADERLRFCVNGTNGCWAGSCDEPWAVRYRGMTFNLRATRTGQVGVFPEQVANWDWILDSPFDVRGMHAINLFGYTGGTTLALAKAGASVTHVDSSKSAVSWARENAAASGLEKHSIRWIVEDAKRFIEREFKRGKHYEIVVADPPSFGRGPSKETWKLERDLRPFLATLAALTRDRVKMVVISCHTPGYDGQKLSRLVADAWSVPLRSVEQSSMILTSAKDRALHSGAVARWRNG